MPLLFIKNSMLQIVIYKKLNFWEEYTPLLSKLPTACKSFLRCEQLLRVANAVYSSHELPKPRYIPNRRYHMLFKIWKISQSHFLCDILRYVFFTKYCRYHIYHMYWDRKRVVHQVKYMTLSHRCCMFF